MTTRTGQQPDHPDARPPTVPTQAMTPLDIARDRLGDYAQGAHVELFGRIDAVHIANRLAYLEQHDGSLRRAASDLLSALHVIQLAGPTPDVMQVAFAIDNTAEELNQR